MLFRSQGHPMGAAAGAIAMRQSVDAAILGIPLDDYAAGHKELSVALETFNR